MKIPKQGCMEWDRAKAGNGYGVISCYKKMYYVHRLVYRIFIGEIGNGQIICHKCDNPKCFNPNHLFIGTQRDNVADMIRKGRQAKFFGSKGEDNPNCKFSDETIFKIRKDLQSGLLSRDIKATYGISSAHLYRIRTNKNRREFL